MAKKSRKKSNNKLYHKDLFLFGVLTAVVFAFFKMKQYYSLVGENVNIPELSIEKYIVLLLVVIGITIGFMNINRKESTSLLLAALVIFLFKYTNFEILQWSWFNFAVYLEIIIRHISILVASAAIVVAIKEFIAVAKD